MLRMYVLSRCSASLSEIFLTPWPPSPRRFKADSDSSSRVVTRILKPTCDLIMEPLLWRPLHAGLTGYPGHARFLLSTCATRAFTSFLTSAIGSGLSIGKWMVPLEVEKPFSSSLKASTTAAVGNKLQWFENAANHTSTPLYLMAGIRGPETTCGRFSPPKNGLAHHTIGNAWFWSSGALGSVLNLRCDTSAGLCSWQKSLFVRFLAFFFTRPAFKRRGRR